MSTYKAVRFLIFILVAFSVIAGSPSLASSQPNATLASDSVQPELVFQPLDQDQSGFLNFDMDPGDQVTASLIVGNGGDAAFDAIVYAADAFSIRNGGFGVREFEDEQTGPTLWLNFPTEQTSLQPGETLERLLTVTVPAGTPAGEYVTALVMQSANPASEDASGALAELDLIYRSAIGVRILVSGDLKAEIDIGEPWFYNDQISYAIIIPVTNTGNVQARPAGEVTLEDPGGRLLLSSPVKMGRVYGGHDTELRLGLSEPLPNGEYQITILLEDEDKGVRAELSATTFAVSDTEGPGLAEQAPVTISSASAAPMPDAESVQFLAVYATITNTEEPVANAQLSLIAKVDGEEFERFPISQSLSVPPGETEVSTRYIPLTGWTNGEWEFELLLETVEGSGAAVVVDRVPIDIKVTVP